METLRQSNEIKIIEPGQEIVLPDFPDDKELHFLDEEGNLLGKVFKNPPDDRFSGTYTLLFKKRKFLIPLPFKDRIPLSPFQYAFPEGIFLSIQGENNLIVTNSSQANSSAPQNVNLQIRDKSAPEVINIPI